VQRSAFADEAQNMETFQEFVIEYKKQLEKGAIQMAYKGLMEYVMTLRTYFKNKYPDYFVSGSIYYLIVSPAFPA
jgi:hypothetical protein